MRLTWGLNKILMSELINGFYLDEFGCFVQADGDGGDSAQRFGMYCAGIKFRELLGLDTISMPKLTFESLALKYYDPDGLLIRHPTQWNDPGDFSRDQEVPFTIALGLWASNRHLINLRKQHDLRILNKYQNSDIPSPHHMAVLDRAQGVDRYYLSDLCFLPDCLFHIAKSKNPDFADDLTFVLMLLQAHFIHPTRASKLAIKVYSSLRYPSYGTSKLGEKNKILGSLAWYFRPETGASPGFVELYRPIILEVFCG